MVSYGRDKCYVIGTGGNVAVNMTAKRKDAAGTIWNDKYLFVAGGWGDDGWQNSSELILLDDSSSIQQTNMPVKTYGHSMVAINTSTVMVIGGMGYGMDAGLNDTYYWESSGWSSGPPLAQARKWHASALLGHHVVTTGGFRMGLTVEIMDLEDFPHQWTQGKLMISYLFY